MSAAPSACTMRCASPDGSRGVTRYRRGTGRRGSACLPRDAIQFDCLRNRAEIGAFVDHQAYETVNAAKIPAVIAVPKRNTLPACRQVPRFRSWHQSCRKCLRTSSNSPHWAVAVPEPSSLSGVRLRRLLFQILLPLTARSEAVHHGPMREGALSGGDVLRPSGPRLLRRGLESPPVAERQSPGQAADPVHGIEMRGCFLVELPA